MNIETQNIEFKESWCDKYLKSICGFANSDSEVTIIYTM
jgi:predicted HTH transcriptional regulator